MDALGSIAWHTRLDQGISDLCRKSPISFPPSDAATLIAAHASLLRLAGAQDGVPVFKLDVMPALTRLARVGIAIDRSDGHRVARRPSANLPTSQAMHYQSIPISIDHPRYPRLTGAVSKLAKPSRPRSRDEGRVSVAAIHRTVTGRVGGTRNCDLAGLRRGFFTDCLESNGISEAFVKTLKRDHACIL
jgi:hypothetical protein